MQCFSIAPDQPSDGVVSNFFILPHLQPGVFQTVDQAAQDAENAFWSTLQAVDSQRSVGKERGLWMDCHMDSTSEEDLD